MSENDPFFDAWVRDKLQQAEVRTPEHLWEFIRKGSRRYGIAERNKYLLFVTLLLGITSGIGYWAFHPVAHGHVYALASSATRGATLSTADADGRRKFAAADGMEHSGVAGSRTTGSRTTGLRTAGSRTIDAAASGVMTTGEIGGTKVDAPMADAPMADPQTVQANSFQTTAPAQADREALNTPPDEQARPLHLISNTGDLSLFSRGSAMEQLMQGSATVGLTPLHLIYKRHTYLEFYAGPDHVTHYITASNKAYIAYVQKAKATESSYPSLSIGMRVDMPLIGDNWRLQSGLHYSQINERLTYANFNDTKTVAEVSVRRVVQSIGDTVLLKDTTSLTYKGQSLKQSLNAYRRLDIPVIVSRTLLRRGPVQVNTSAGALFNITSWYNGDILDTNYVPIALHSSTRKGVAAWKSTIGTSLYGSIAIYDQLTSHIQATLEPYLRYDLSPVNKETSIYKEKFVTTGLMFGIRYQLGK